STVAYLPDSAFFTRAKEPQESGASLRSLVSALFTSRSVTADLDDGWLTVRPSRPYSDRRRSMDRAAFRRLVAQGAEFGSIPFDDFADFVATTTQDETVWVAGHLLGRSLPVTLSLPKIGLDVVRIYGLMPPAIRAKLYTTGVPISDLGNLDRYVLPLREASNVVNEIYQPPQWRVRRAFNEHQEAWQTMPQGMSWKLKAVRSKFIMPRQTESAVGAFRSFMSARAFASNMFRVQRRPDLAYGRDYQFAAVVDGVELLLEYQQGDRLTGTNGSNYADPLSRLDYVAFNDIPADLKAEIKEFYEDYKKAFERRSGGGGK
ncbi:MAG: hypothetical protein IIC73_05020, partial [Armatimonadetes bacterium]|nr:hypothetical protein [Armatimonadota bacterium]